MSTAPDSETRAANGSPRESPPVVLTIAGFDPSGGAGLTADLKVFAAHDVYGVAAATALTVQSTAGVERVEPVLPAILAETLACLAADLPLAGIKIGMLATEQNVDEVANFLERGLGRGLPVVLDPVLCSSSGHALLDQRGVQRMRVRLLPLVSCATPNLDELLLLTGQTTKNGAPASHASVAEAAALLAQQFPKLGVVATGGHLDQPDDYVLPPGLEPRWLPGEWVRTTATHGTGCGYSSALLCGLVQGLSLIDAAAEAKRYVTEALQAAMPIGRGGGSMDHFYRQRFRA